MVVEKKRKYNYLVCRKCGRMVKLKGEKVLLKESILSQRKDVVVMEKDEVVSELPKTKIICPKCENTEAYWWMQQTRGADEPPTTFYKCTRCGYSWRSYA